MTRSSHARRFALGVTLVLTFSLLQAGSASAQTILVDATVPLAAAIGGRATRTLGVWQGSAAAQAVARPPMAITTKRPRPGVIVTPFRRRASPTPPG